MFTARSSHQDFVLFIYKGNIFLPVWEPHSTAVAASVVEHPSRVPLSLVSIASFPFTSSSCLSLSVAVSLPLPS